MIKQIKNQKEKINVTKEILENLPEWFGLPESTKKYVEESAEQIVFCFYLKDKPVGFLALKETSKHTVEIAVMGVLKAHHSTGIGRELLSHAKNYINEKGYSFIQVKTVEMGKNKNYDTTNKFYLSMGFKELEVLPTLWDKHNPCQIYIMAV